MDERFRRQLVQLLPQWVETDLITADQAAAIRAQYQLDDLQASNRFATILAIVGSLLVGLGIISLVAANWDYFSPAFRAIAVVLVMLSTSAVGFWALCSGKRWGIVALLIGQLSLGACIGLMAQWFQVSGDPAGLFLAWGGGVLLMAFSLRNSIVATLATILLLFSIDAIDSPVTPFLLPIVMVGLAYWCRSRWVFFLGTALISFSVTSTVQASANANELYEDYTTALIFLSLMGLYWVGSLLYRRTDEPGLDFGPIAQFKALLGMITYLSFWSFSYRHTSWFVNIEQPLWQSLLSHWGGYVTLVYLLVAIALWGVALTRRPLTQIDQVLTAIWLGALILLNVGALWGISVILYNLLLFGLGCAVLWQGLQTGIRWRFWLGMLAITGQIMCRFFEYDTGLLLKALALIVCGAGVIILGIRFEQRSLRAH